MHGVPNFAYWPTLQQHSVALVLTTWFAMTHAKKHAPRRRNLIYDTPLNVIFS